MALAAHPGASGTELMRHITFGPEALSAAALKLAQSPAMGALPQALQQRLWSVSGELTGVSFPV
ncbi:oxidoreductase ephD [Mycobacteroides abscessus subsp. massiliense]|nr:oxidoreductase ephD [Mycobacteroides abscessus subsp. massiliense]